MSRDERQSDLDMDEFAAARRARRRQARWKRPRRILGIWARLGMLAAVVVVSVFLSYCLVIKAIRPYREASLQSGQLAQTRQESALLSAENAGLVRRIAYLKTDQGIASEARRMGYLRPGEIPIVVEGAEAQPEAGKPAPFTPTPVLPEGSAASRFWRHLTGH